MKDITMAIKNMPHTLGCLVNFMIWDMMSLTLLWALCFCLHSKYPSTSLSCSHNNLWTILFDFILVWFSFLQCPYLLDKRAHRLSPWLYFICWWYVSIMTCGSDSVSLWVLGDHSKDTLITLCHIIYQSENNKDPSVYRLNKFPHTLETFDSESFITNLQ